ncbi:MAG: hypothetical protein J6A59_18245 [Lachnospiraceae bacterium]|nr:hypothetical protein [Lachnospiraceae bacterium]
MGTEPRDNYQLMLQEAIEKARSFSGLRPPNQAILIGSRVSAHDTIDYYRDDDGNFYYETHRGRAFKEQMAKAEKERRKLRYGA